MPINPVWEELVKVSCIPVFLVGVLGLMLLRWYLGPKPSDLSDPSFGAVQNVLWLIVAGSFFVGWIFILPGLLETWLTAAAVVIAMAYHQRVKTQQYAVLALLAAAAERQAPLPLALAAIGREYGGWLNRRLKKAVQLLTGGVPLPTVLEHMPGVVPPEALPAVRVGHESGNLPRALRRAAEARALFDPAWHSIIPKVALVCVLPAFAAGIIEFLRTSILPQFRKIFLDFGQNLPPITTLVLSGGQNNSFAVTIWFVIAIVSLLLCVYVLLVYAGMIRWQLPGAGFLVRRLHRATVLDAVSIAADRGLPLLQAIDWLIVSYPQRHIARRLAAVADDIQAGIDECDSLYRHGLLGSADLAVLRAARRNGNLGWAAHEMADSNRRRFIYRVQMLVQSVFPPIIIAQAVLVATVAAAVLIPLIALIQNLARP